LFLWLSVKLSTYAYSRFALVEIGFFRIWKSSNCISH
jgi:hypothetical protein